MDLKMNKFALLDTDSCLIYYIALLPFHVLFSLLKYL